MQSLVHKAMREEALSLETPTISVTELSPQRLALAKAAYTTRRVPQEATTTLLAGAVTPRAGDLVLARALLGNPAVLLLDEADANLDPHASAVLDRVLAEYSGTVLCVTHRPDRLAQADIIWYLEGGRLVEVGTPAELLGGDSATARFFRHVLAMVS